MFLMNSPNGRSYAKTARFSLDFASSIRFLAWSFLGAFAGMSAIGLMHAHLMLPKTHMPLLVGSFGAMSVILFSGFKTPVAQPKNVIIGHSAQRDLRQERTGSHRTCIKFLRLSQNWMRV